MATPNGTNLRSLYYPSNWPATSYAIPTTAVTKKPAAGSLYLNDQYGSTTLSSTLTNGNGVAFVASSGADTISATTTATSSSINAAYGFKVFAAEKQSLTPSLQLNGGNDTLTATALASPLVSASTKQVKYFYLTGIENLGEIYGGRLSNTISGEQLANSGNDTLSGTGTYRGVANLEEGFISLGDGDDKLTGVAGSTNIIGSAGVYNAAGLLLGVSSGNVTDKDTLTATGSYTGLYNEGSILFYQDSDTLTAKAGTLFNQQTGVFNSGLIDFGAGVDTFTSTGFTAIYNSGTIAMGTGTSSTAAGDKITATGTYFGIFNDKGGLISFDSSTNARSITASGAISAIKNNGVISFTGTANDTVTATKGGFSGDLDGTTGLPLGKIQLGAGNDALLGFGTGIFDGGTGTNAVTLPSNSAYAGEVVEIASTEGTTKGFKLVGTQNVVGTGYFVNFTNYNKLTIPVTTLGEKFYLTISAAGVATKTPMPADWV